MILVRRDHKVSKVKPVLRALQALKEMQALSVQPEIPDRLDHKVILALLEQQGRKVT